MPVLKKKTLLFTLALVMVSFHVWAKIPADLQSRFDDAVQLAKDGKTARAEKLYRKLIDQYPKVPELYNNLAVLLVKQGKQEQAVKVLEQGLRSQESYASIYNNLVDINLSLSRRNYMKALVPVGDDTPKLQNNNKLSEIADIYYGKPDEQQLAMAEALKKAEAARDQAEARAREEARAKAKAQERARAEAEARARAEAEAATRARAVAEAKARAEAEAQAKAEAEEKARLAAEAKARAEEKARAEAKARALAEAQAKAEAKLAQNDEKLVDEVPPVMNLEDQAYAAIMSWAGVWSRQDVTGYIASYVDGYSPPGKSHAQWVRDRRVRLTRPAFIKVDLSNFEYFILDSTHIAVHFKQKYARKNYHDQEQKELILVRQGDGWKIEKESSL